MKRLIRIGSGLFIYSIIPIMSWIVLSYVLGDDRISNVFSITYALQFIWATIKLIFATGANIRKEKDKDENSVMNGIFWGAIFSCIIFSIPLIFVEKYISFFGQDANFYKVYVRYSIILMCLQTLFTLIIEKLYFEDKEKTANKHLFCFNILNFIILILSALIFKKAQIAVSITLISLLFYIICLYFCNVQKFKIDFKFYKNIRYESANIISEIAMLIIYLFGFKTMFSAGEEYLAAINIAGLCTDTQWDTMDAIATVAKVDISKGRYNYKKELKNSYIFTLILISTSIVMSYSVGYMRKAPLRLVSVYLMLQVLDMLLYPFTLIITTSAQIEYSPLLCTVISLGAKTIRTIVSVTLISPYCTDIAQIMSGIILFTSMLIIRIRKYKVQNGKLILKNPVIKNAKSS